MGINLFGYAVSTKAVIIIAALLNITRKSAPDKSHSINQVLGRPGTDWPKHGMDSAVFNLTMAGPVPTTTETVSADYYGVRGSFGKILAVAVARALRVSGHTAESWGALDSESQGKLAMDTVRALRSGGKAPGPKVSKAPAKGKAKG